MERVMLELVQPVIGGKVDMAMAEYSDKVCGQCGTERAFFHEFLKWKGG